MINENRTYVINMFVRLLALEFDDKVCIDFTQCSRLLLNLELKPSESNNLSWDVITYDRVYCVHCGAVHKLPVGLPVFYFDTCSLCNSGVPTWRHKTFETLHPIARHISNTPIDLRREIVNQFLDQREKLYELQRNV